MKTRILLVGALSAGVLLAMGAKDRVIMTVNGVDVPKSEFEYLYHKNSRQQLNPQKLEEYVEMFKNYRLKVAEAQAAGIDTTTSFRQEMEQYRHDLAAPYVTDSVYLNQLVKEAYDRSREEVQSSHIMIFRSKSEADNKAALAKLDSLRGVLAAGGDFEALATQYSEDRGSNQRGGSLGWITAGRLPYNYEVTAFSLKPGEISEVTTSPMGYHLLKGGKHRPARGQVHVSHIMKMLPPNADAEMESAAKNKIDSIYAILQTAPARFEELAINLSDDKSSGRNGGLLPWFGAGQMVEAFDSVSFALPDEAISQPFRSPYGWHIVYKLESKPAPSYDEVKSVELKRIDNPQDERYQMVRDRLVSTLARRHKGVMDQEALSRMKLGLIMNGLDSAFYQNYTTVANRSQVVGQIGNKKLTAGELIDTFHGATQPDPAAAERLFDDNANLFFYNNLMDAEETRLEAEEPEYRNLLHEYVNGSMLYEISVQKVWDRASKDEEGLKNYFETHRDDYKWSEPRAKGILVQAKNDSVAQAVMARYKELPADEALKTLRREFRNEIQVDKVLAAKGQNAMVDNLLFGAPETKPAGNNYTVYFMIDGRVLDAPEEYTDVRGQVTGDYQEMLEQNWIADMRARYPIVVYDKVLKQVK